MVPGNKPNDAIRLHGEIPLNAGGSSLIPLGDGLHGTTGWGWGSSSWVPHGGDRTQYGDTKSSFDGKV